MQPVTAPALDRILAFLAPLFLQECGGDPRAARHAASETLAAYAAATDQQLRLAALIIAFSMRALDALARAAEPDLDVRTVLRLNGSANALNRAALQCQRLLDRLRAERPEVEPDCVPIPESVDAPGLLDFVRTTLRATPGLTTGAAAAVSLPSTLKLSRQQRRAAERRAEKASRQPQDAARPERAVISSVQSAWLPASLPA